MPVSRGITGHCGLEDYFKARWKALSSFVGREKTEMEKKEEGRKVQAKKRSGKTRTSWALTARNTKYKHNSRWSGPCARPTAPLTRGDGTLGSNYASQRSQAKHLLLIRRDGRRRRGAWGARFPQESKEVGRPPGERS